jgi:hypothetical protein
VAIEFVGGNTAGKAGAASGNTTIALNSGLTGGIAAAASSGDLVIACFATGAIADRTLAITDGTTGYTLINSELYSNDTFDTNLRVAYKFITSDTATTFGPTGDAADSGAMAVYVFRGVNTSTPLDVAAVPATGIDTSRANPASITPTTTGAYVVIVGAAAHNGGVDTFTSSDLTDFQTVGGTNDTNDVTLGVGHFAWTSGPFDAAAFGHSQVDNAGFSWAAMSVALRPAPDTVDDLLANDVSSASSVSAPAIAQAHALNANDVSSASTVSAAALGQVHVLLANDVSSASSLSAPTLAEAGADELLANSVSSASSVSTPALGQIHALLASDVESGSSVSAPALSEGAEEEAPALSEGAEEEAPARTGGGSYLTEGELRALAKRRKKERDERKAFDQSIKDAYRDTIEPGWKARERARRIKRDDEEALVLMVLQNLDKILEDA